MPVVVKALKIARYCKQARRNGITEGKVIRMLQDNSKIINLVEEFTQDGVRYMVMKHFPGGDLCSYLKHNRVTCLPEIQVKSIVS